MSCSVLTGRIGAARRHQLLTVADIAAHIGAHEATVRGWITRGELKAARFSTRIGYRIRRGDYDDCLQRRMLMNVIARQLLRSPMPGGDSVP